MPACLCQKVNPVAEQYIPLRDLNAGAPSIHCAGSQTLTSSRTAVLARVERRRRGEGVAKVATFTEDATAGVLSWQQERAWQSVRAARARRAGNATGVQAAAFLGSS